MSNKIHNYRPNYSLYAHNIVKYRKILDECKFEIDRFQELNTEELAKDLKKCIDSKK